MDVPLPLNLMTSALAAWSAERGRVHGASLKLEIRLTMLLLVAGHSQTAVRDYVYRLASHHNPGLLRRWNVQLTA